jgi:hypothetical protein
MQLSIELLPAPFGPMMARISCSRTSKLMSVSAFTPPNDRLMFWMSRMTSPAARPACGGTDSTSSSFDASVTRRGGFSALAT